MLMKILAIAVSQMHRPGALFVGTAGCVQEGYTVSTIEILTKYTDK